jgi:hypothetical protein
LHMGQRISIGDTLAIGLASAVKIKRNLNCELFKKFVQYCLVNAKFIVNFTFGLVWLAVVRRLKFDALGWKRNKGLNEKLLLFGCSLFLMHRHV